MFEAQYLFEGKKVFSPWMPRSGDNIIFTADLVAFDNAKLIVKVFHKKAEDEGPGTAVGNALNATVVGQSSRGVFGLRDMVRYQFEAVSTRMTAQTTDNVQFRMLDAVWFDDVGE